MAEEERPKDKTGKRSREKRSKVTLEGECVAGRVEGGLGMRGPGKAVVCNARSTSLPLQPCARGTFERARAMLASPGQRRAGFEKLRSEACAATSRRTRRSRIKTLRKLAVEAGVDLVQVTNAGMELLEAALTAGAYRSAAAYLGIWKQTHAKAGHPWAAALAATRVRCGRSLGRGIGPAKRAAVVRLEALPDRWERAGTTDRARSDVPVVAAILVDQAEIAQDQKSAYLWLWPSKTNLSGKECQRILRCACKLADHLFIGTRVCLVHALQRTLRREDAAGFTSKHPIV